MPSLPVVRAADAGTPFDLTVALVECKEVEEIDERYTSFKHLPGTRSGSVDHIGGLLSLYVATLPWGKGHEARVPPINRNLMLGVFRI